MYLEVRTECPAIGKRDSTFLPPRLSRAAPPESYFVTNYLLKVQSQRLEQRNTIWCYTKEYNSSCAASFIDMTDCSGGI